MAVVVFEQIYSAEFLHDHPKYGFLAGIAYTVISIFIALMIFPDDPALIAVGLISLFLMPSLFRLTDQMELSEREISSFYEFLNRARPHVKVYISIFFGIFFTFAFFSIILPKLASSHLFATQLAVLGGKASVLDSALWWNLFSWNLQVLGLSFFLSLIAGNGAIFFIAWNASVWGTVFGNLAKTAALATTANPFILFILVILSVFPHTFLEGLSYMLSAISGTTLSSGFVKENILSSNMWVIIKYNFALLAIAMGVLALGMLVETYVLGNFTTYRTIINLAFRR